MLKAIQVVVSIFLVIAFYFFMKSALEEKNNKSSIYGNCLCAIFEAIALYFVWF